jgi:MerR family copper efflux transcriptional regulator
VSATHSTTRPIYSGELARLAGVSTDTLRYYERSGLLPVAPRSASGYRLYPRETLHRVCLIRSALSIGFSVRDLAGIFRERDREHGVPCRHVRDLAARKLAQLESQLQDMRSWRRELRATLAEWDVILAKTPVGQKARLLETLASTHPKTQARTFAIDVLVRGSRRRGKP